ncbi:tripartite tricarboxylate transporter substrate-binding protein [Belnapia mucosa]|nr:tripartite tricarboxylate transporter substrate-binding protein [Belnapia mucosa]
MQSCAAADSTSLMFHSGAGRRSTANCSAAGCRSASTLVSFGPSIEAGRLRALATLHAERLPTHPDLPTVAEAPGLEGLEASGFIGIAAPASTPSQVVARLDAAVAAVMAETDLPARFAAQGVLSQPAGAAAFGALLTRDRASDIHRQCPAATIGPLGPDPWLCGQAQQKRLG